MIFQLLSQIRWEILAILPVLSVLMLVHELGHFLLARRAGIVVQEFGFGLPPRIVGIERHGVIYSLNWIPFGAFVRLLGEEDPSAPGSFASKSRLTRAVVLGAGSGMNFLLAVLVFGAGHMVGWPTLKLDAPVRIAEVLPTTPAEQAGIQPGDIVLRFDGEELGGIERFRALTQSNLGRRVTLQLQRGNERTEVTLVPRENPPPGQGFIGVRLGSPVFLEKHAPLQALWLGLVQSARVVGLVLSLPSLLIQGQLDSDAARVVGLPGMAQITTDAVDYSLDSGVLWPIFSVVGGFSAMLAIANILPLPALDGGRLFFVLVEAVRGRRVSPNREAAVHFVGLLLLLTVMLAASINDILSPLKPIDWDFR